MGGGLRNINTVKLPKKGVNKVILGTSVLDKSWYLIKLVW